MAGVGVKIIVRNNDGDLVQLANYIHRGDWEVVQNAEEGSVGMSTLYLEDTDESIWTTLGLDDGARRQIRLVDYQSGKIVQFGYTGRRTIRRRYDDYGTPVSRAWAIEIWDPNTVIQRRVLTHHGAKRPRETDVERIQWLITAAEWDIVDQFIIGTTSTKTMSKADYRGQMVADVISDCSQQANKNYWLDIVDDGAGDRLTFWYGKDNRDYYSSTLSISNDLADLDVTALGAGTTTLVYPPANDTEYQMDPSRLFTGVAIQWEKGLVYRHSITGATQFERWDTVIQAPNVHEKDRAIERAENMLERLVEAGEDVRIESGILVPASQAHLVRAGMKIPVKLTHIPEMTSYVDCRILSRGLSPRGDGYRYWIPLTLEPIGPADVAPSCSTALGDAVTASLTTQHYDAPGLVSIDITPVEGAPVAIIGGLISKNNNTPWDTDMAGTGAWNTLYSAETASGAPTFAHVYDTVASPSGTYTITGSFTPGYGPESASRWTAAAVAIQTSATAPVQTKSHADTVNNTVTLDTPPTVGNALIMVLAIRAGSSSDMFTGVVDSAVWTTLAASYASSGVSTSLVGVFMRCVESGDGSAYSIVSSSGSLQSISEWEIT